ncbi:FAD-binding domain-containing protein [Methyloversatilis thermotolerans]|uniref:FAD-binding domain-containing protein n=1 Tax=Methyloversatilis thermotolerans TaxID=1346290 RepID=UPI000363CCB9|nr:FAD-binding domain-containing protein [Methyloversatilis thermotolerans]
MHIVWFKRDLRISDHAPLCAAASAGPVLALHVMEPALLAQADVDARHLGFLVEALDDLESRLAALGVRLLLKVGDMPQVLDALHRLRPVSGLWSHEETGNLASFARDRAVAAWCRAHAVPWRQFPSGGVVRALRDRDDWSAIWLARMTPAPLPPPDRATGVDTTGWPAVPAALPLVSGADVRDRQRAGLRNAQTLLDDFLVRRVIRYRRGMSSPLSGGHDCSRLSPHLALGTLSLREVVHAVWHARARWQAEPSRRHADVALAGLKSFESRLHWHCHFVQKLETEPALEQRAVNRLYDGLREPDFSPALHRAWCAGQTGFPFIDACMRALIATGWINFRMRAMLVAFSSYHLWNHWREPGLHLARLFTDYEPGIHWPQVQMQSGVTGINALRIYNPVKQQLDQDPDGVFVRRWLPELARVPRALLAEPWRMDAVQQRESGCVIGRDYPPPIVDHLAAARAARARLGELRRLPEAAAEARRVFALHGSRNPAREGLPARARRREGGAGQMDFGF